MPQAEADTNLHRFLQGGGETGALIRQFNWSKTPLGTPDQWPYSLRTSVSNLLRANLPMLVLWGNDHICFYNDAVIPSLSLDKHPALGKPAREIWSEGWDFVGPLLNRVLQTGEPVSFQDAPVTYYRNGQTGQVYWTFSYSQVLDDEGAPGGVLVHCLETTQAVLDRQHLQMLEQRFRSLVNQAPVAMALFRGSQFVIELANERVLEYWGRRLEEVIDKPLFEALPEASGQGLEELLTGVYTTGERYVAKELTVLLERNGVLAPTYIDFVYDAFREADGTISGVTVVCNEITEQVLARQKLEENQERLRFTLKAGHLGSWELDLVTFTLTASELCKINFGQPVDEPFTYQTLQQTIHPDDRQRQQEAVAATMTIGADYDIEYRVIWPDATVHWVNIRGQLHRNEAGVPVTMVGVSTDITARKKAESILKDNEAKFRTLIEQAPVATCLFTGRNMVIEVANELMISFFGKGRSILNKPVRDVLTIDNDQSAIALLDQVFATGEAFVATGTPANLIINGVPGTYYFDLSLKPLRNEAGEVYAILETAVDVTEQVLARQKIEESQERYRRLSDELEQQVQKRTRELATVNEKLGTSNSELIESNDNLIRSNDNLEKFAYIASHDLQEPLRKIQSFGDILKEQYGSELGEGTTYLERMQSAANRMSTLIRDLLTFSRISTRQERASVVPLSEVINSVLSDLELRILETGATMQVDPLPTVPGDRSQLELLFQNLLSNALKFRRADVRPVVHVTCNTVAYDNLPPSVKPARATKTYYCFTVADNGIGFDEKYLDRIFQVFQRLHGKNEFAGTGIGLAICEKVVTNHGGAITATSQPGQGSTFMVYLPQ